MTQAITLSSVDARILTDRIKVGVEAVWDLITQAYTERAWDVLGYSSWDDYCTREFGTSRLRLPREERSEVVASLRESGLSIRAIASATGHGVATIKRDLDAAPVPNGTPADPAPVVDPAPEPLDVLADLGNDPEAIHPATGECIHCHQSIPLAHLYEGGEGYECDPCVTGEPEPEPEPQPDPEPVAPKPIIGLDGKTYTPSAKPKPAAPRRASIIDTARNLGLDLGKITTRIESLSADDRLTKNRTELTARLRHQLGLTIKALNDLNNQLGE